MFAALIGSLLPVVVAPLEDEGYRLPPQEVVDIVDAPTAPRVQMSPDMRHMLLVEYPSLPSIEDVARPWIGLAGRRIDPANNVSQLIELQVCL